MKNAKLKLMTAVCIMAAVACSDDDSSSSPSPTGGGTGGGGGSGSGTTNTYQGSASYGDILDFSIDQSTNTYTANNLTTGANVTNGYDVLDAALDVDGVLYDVYEGLYEVDEGTDGRSYAIEIADRILAGNFPSGRAENDIFLAVTDETSLIGQEDQIVGTYFYVKLAPGLQDQGGNEWGQFTIEPDADLYGFAKTTESPEDASYSLPVDSADVANNPTEGFYYSVDFTSDGKALEMYDENDDLIPGVVAYTYLDGESTALMIDLGTGEGTIFAFKTDMDQLNGNEDFSSYVNEYKYVDFYENFEIDKGAGNFAVNANKTFDYSLIGYNADPAVDDYYVDVTTDIQMTWTQVPGVYYSADWDGQGSTIYHIFAGDFVMYFDYDSNDQFKGYGIGGEL